MRRGVGLHPGASRLKSKGGSRFPGRRDPQYRAFVKAHPCAVVSHGESHDSAVKQVLDLSEALEAERLTRAKAARETQQAEFAQMRAERVKKEARLKEIEERLQNPAGLDTPVCEGAPTLREVLTEEHSELMAELYG